MTTRPEWCGSSTVSSFCYKISPSTFLTIFFSARALAINTSSVLNECSMQQMFFKIYKDTLRKAIALFN